MLSPSTAVTIPESYIAYRESGERRKAYDLINSMDGRLRGLPPEFTFDDINAFYEARFALSVVQYEYYCFLREFWNLTWGAALPEAHLQEFTAKDYAENYSGSQFFSLETVWTYMFQRAFRLYPQRDVKRDLWLGGYLNGAEQRLYIFLGIYNGDKDVTRQEFKSSDSAWQPSSRFGGKAEGLCLRLDKALTGDNPTVVVDKLRSAASKALNTLQQP